MLTFKQFYFNGNVIYLPFPRSEKNICTNYFLFEIPSAYLQSEKTFCPVTYPISQSATKIINKKVSSQRSLSGAIWASSFRHISQDPPYCACAINDALKKNAITIDKSCLHDAAGANDAKMALSPYLKSKGGVQKWFLYPFDRFVWFFSRGSRLIGIDDSLPLGAPQSTSTALL